MRRVSRRRWAARRGGGEGSGEGSVVGLDGVGEEEEEEEGAGGCRWRSLGSMLPADGELLVGMRGGMGVFYDRKLARSRRAGSGANPHQLGKTHTVSASVKVHRVVGV